MVAIGTREDVKQGIIDFLDEFFAAADEIAEENEDLPVGVYEFIDDFCEKRGFTDNDFIEAVKYALSGFYIFGDKIIIEQKTVNGK